MFAHAQFNNEICSIRVTQNAMNPPTTDLSLNILEIVATDIFGVNQALAANGGTAVASSSNSSSTPGGAIDGNLSSGCCGQLWHSSGNPPPGEWIEVTLGQPSIIILVDVLGRRDCCPRLNDVLIELKDCNGVTVYSTNPQPTSTNQQFVDRFGLIIPPTVYGTDYGCENVVRGVQVIEITDLRGQVMNILEVQAFDLGGVNVAAAAAGATAAGPTASGGPPGGAIDGNLSRGCCGQLWHSSGGNQTLTINLAAPSDISYLDVWGRDACCPRLTHFQVTYRDGAGTVLYQKEYEDGDPVSNGTTFDTEHVRFASPCESEELASQFEDDFPVEITARQLTSYDNCDGTMQVEFQISNLGTMPVYGISLTNSIPLEYLVLGIAPIGTVPAVTLGGVPTNVVVQAFDIGTDILWFLGSPFDTDADFYENIGLAGGSNLVLTLFGIVDPMLMACEEITMDVTGATRVWDPFAPAACRAFQTDNGGVTNSDEVLGQFLVNDPEPTRVTLEVIPFRSPLIFNDCGMTRDIGCLYNEDLYEVFLPEPDVEMGDCVDFAVTTSTLVTQVGCDYTVVYTITASNACALAGLEVTNCVQTYQFTVDREPPKIISVNRGRDLGCIPDGTDPVDFMAANAPLAADISSVVATNNCGDCDLDIELWCDTYSTDGCVITLDRKIRVTDCCDNVSMATIVYTTGTEAPIITSTESGGVLGCRSPGFIPPTNLNEFAIASTQTLFGSVCETVACEFTGTFSGASLLPALPFAPQLWLDGADAETQSTMGGLLDQWKDKSGNGRNADQTSAANQPGVTVGGLNGQNVLTFDGVDDFLNVDLDFLAGGAHSAFIVTLPVNYNNIYGAANPGAGANSLHVGFNNAANYRVNYWGNDFGAPQGAVIGPNFNPGQANIMNYVWTPGVAKEVFANGVLDAVQLGAAGTPGIMSGGGRIVNVVNQGFFGGDIAEIIMYNRALTQAEREVIEGYLAHKWGLQASLPAGHPFTTTAPDFACYEGDGAIGLQGVTTGTYSTSLTADCSPTNLVQWSSLQLDQSIPSGATIMVDVSDSANTVLTSATDQAVIDLTGITDPTLNILITLTTPDAAACPGPLVESICGVFECASEPPTNLVVVTDRAITNDVSCEVTILRTYRYETCCGLFDEETITFTYTQLPDLETGALAKLDLGCIASTNQIPPVDLTMLAATSDCAIVSITKKDTIDLYCKTFEQDLGFVSQADRVLLTSAPDPDNGPRGMVGAVDLGVDGDPGLGNGFMLPTPQSNFMIPACATNAPNRSYVFSMDYFIPANTGATAGTDLIRFTVRANSNIGGSGNTSSVQALGDFDLNAGPLGEWVTVSYTNTLPLLDAANNPVTHVFPFISFDERAPFAANDGLPDVYIDNVRFTFNNPDCSPRRVDDCTWQFERYFEVETLCGVKEQVEQEVCYTLNNTRPEIIAVEKGQDWGCQPAGFFPPVDLDALAMTNAQMALVTTNFTLDVNDNNNQFRVFQSGGDGNVFLFDEGTTANNSRQQYQWLNFNDELGLLPTGANIVSARLTYPGASCMAFGEQNDPVVQIGLYDVPDTSMGQPSIFTAPRDGCEMVDYFAANTPVDATTVAEIDAGSASWDVTSLVTLWQAGGGSQRGEFMLLPDRNQNCGNPMNQPGIVCVRFTGAPVLEIIYDPAMTDADYFNITNRVMTNGCDVMFMREFRIEDCCGNFDRREVVHTYTLQPDAAVVEALAPLDLGCIDSLGQIPPPSDLLVMASSECSVVQIEWCGDSENNQTLPIALPIPPQLWLDASDASTITASGGLVSQWNDKSGNGRNATQANTANQPALTAGALNGNSVLLFDGVSDFFNVDLDFLAGGSHSAFIVTLPTGYNNIYGAATGGSGANSLHVGFGNNANYRVNYWGNDFGPPQGATITPGGPFKGAQANILNYVWVPGVVKEIYANGSLDNFQTGAAGTPGTMAGGGRISNVVGQGFFGGDIAEIIMYNQTLSDSERETVEAYLAQKWGLESCLPETHPFAAEATCEPSSSITRCYQVIDICGQTSQVEQVIAYIEEGEPPRILETAPFIDYGCEGDQRASGADLLFEDFDVDGDDGATLGSWTDVQGSSVPADQIFSDPGNFGGRGAGGFSTGGNQDSAHTSLIMRSPGFLLVPGGSINFQLAGGQGAGATPANDASVPVNSTTSGGQGVGLRRASDGAYLLHRSRSGGANSYQMQSFTAADLAPIIAANPGEVFTIDYYDYYHGGFGFAMIDDVDLSQMMPLAGDPTYSGQYTFTTSGDVASTNLVMELRLTNDCRVTVTRTWRIEDCCGNFDVRDEVYQYTDVVNPVQITSCPADVFLGCLPTPAQLPPPVPGLIQTMDGCDPGTVWLGDRLTPQNDCLILAERFYGVIDVCGQMEMCTQQLFFVIESDPTILAGPTSIVFGCTNAAPVLPIADDLAALVVTNTVCLPPQPIPPVFGVRVRENDNPLGENFTEVRELQAIDSTGVNVALSSNGSMPFSVGDCCGGNIADAFDDNLGAGNWWHGGGLTNHWVGTFFATPSTDLDTITVFVRTDCCGNSGRRNNFFIELLGVGGAVIASTNIIDTTIDDVGFVTINAADLLAPLDDEVCLDCPVTTNVIENVTTTNGCDMIITRTFEVVSECGFTDETTVTYRWTPQPGAPVIMGQPFVDLGCITSEGLVPVPNPGQFEVTTTCGDHTIFLESQTSPTPTSDCDWMATRTYAAVSICNETSTFTQVFVWRIDCAPEILSTPLGSNLGCQVTGYLPPTNTADVVVNDCVPLPDMAFDRELCSADFLGGIFVDAMVIPRPPANTNTKQYVYNAGDIPFVAEPTDEDDVFPEGLFPNGNPWASTNCNVVGGPVLPGPLTPTGNVTLVMLDDPAITNFVGSDQAICLDGVDDVLTGPTLETTGAPRIDQNPATIEICLAVSNFANTATQLVFETGGAEGLALTVSGSTLSLHAQNAGGSTSVSIDLAADLGLAAGEWACVQLAWDNLRNEISLSADGINGARVSCCAPITFADTIDMDGTSLGGPSAGGNVLGGSLDPLANFAGKIATISIYNGYGRGVDGTTDLYCDHSALVGTNCGAIVLADNCVNCGVATQGFYGTVIESQCATQLFGWVDLELDYLIPTGGAINVFISDGITTNGPIAATNSIDLSGFPNSSTQLALVFELIYTGDVVCATPAIFGWTANRLCGTETNNPGIVVTDTITTNSLDGCDITVRRTYRVESCCGRFDEHEEFYTYTATPEIFLGTIPKLDMGCISSTNLIHQPNFTILNYTAACGLVRMDYIDTINPNQDRCTGSFQRVYEIEDVCGAIALTTQDVCWVLAEQPEITDAEIGRDWGCQDPATFSPPGFMSATNFLSATTNESIAITGCVVSVRREYRIEDCCGNFDRWEVTHTFTATPTPATVEALDTLDLGCIASSNQIPPASAIIVQVQTAACNIAGISWEGDSAPTNLTNSVCGEMIERVYQVTDVCGQPTVITQAITYTIDAEAPRIDSVPTFIDHGCVTADPQPADTNLVAVSDDNPHSLELSWWEVALTNDCVVTVTRSWRVEDCCGKFDLKDEVYQYSLTPSVIITAPADIDLGCLNDPAQVPPAVPSAVNAQAEGCPVTVVHTGDSVTNAGCNWVVTRVYTASNDCGGSASATQTLTFVVDTEEPKFVTNPSAALGCDTAALPTPQDDLDFFNNSNVSDNCGATVSFMGAVTVTNGCQLSMTRSYMAADDCGNSVLEDVTYTWLLDSGAPVFAATNFVDAGCVLSPSQIAAPSTANLGVTDDCLLASVQWLGDSTHALVNPGDPCTRQFTRLYLATDACGNATFFTQTVQFVEFASPEILAHSEGSYLGCVTGEPDAFQIPLWSRELVYTTNGVIFASHVDTRTTNDCLVTLHRQWRVENCCGEFDTAETTWTWTATPAVPGLTGVPVIDLGCITALGQIPVPATSQFAVDAGCGASVRYLGVSPTNESSNCANEFTRSYEVADRCGGTNTFVQTIRYVLNTTPVRITGTETGQSWTCLDEDPELPEALAQVTFVGEADGLFVEETRATNGCAVSVTRVYTISDCCGNTHEATVSFDWTVPADAPQISGPTSIDLGCLNGVGQVPVPSTSQFTLDADCGGTISYVPMGEVPVRNPDNACAWSLTRSYQAVDNCGQTNDILQTFTWELAEEPEILATQPGQSFTGCHADSPVPEADFSQLVASGTIVTSSVRDVMTPAEDNCSMTLVRTWRVETCCGAFDTESVTYTWNVLPTPPVLSGPASIDLGCLPDAGQVPQPSSGGLTVASDCGATIAHLGDSAPATDGCLTTVERLWIATDHCGQTSGFTQVITYSLDNTLPVITGVEAPLTLGCETNNPVPPPDFAQLAFTGDVIETDVSAVIETNRCTVTMTRTFVVTDCCGNSDDMSVTHSWQLTPAAPSISGPALIELGCIPSAGFVPVPATSQFSVDSACGAELAYAGERPPETTACLTTLRRLYTATDDCGQSTTVTQVITYSLNNIPPEITGTPPGGHFGCVPADPTPAPDLNAITFNGSVITSSVSDTLWEDDCLKTLRRTYRVEDCCGNSDTRVVEYSWTEDATPPVITAGPDFQTGIDLGCNPTLVQLPPINPGLVSASDACGPVSVIHLLDRLETNGCQASVSRVYGAIDDCGNQGSITQSFTYALDTVAPQPSIVPASVSLGCVTDGAPAIPDPGASVLAVTDMCGAPIATNLVEETTTNAGCLVILTRTYQITDACGNTGIASQDITWTDDSQAPLLDCPQDLDLGCNPGLIPPVAPGLPLSADGCGAAFVEHGGDSIATNGCERLLSRVYAATDVCGNQSACTQLISWIESTSPPVLTGAPGGGDLSCGTDAPAPDPSLLMATPGDCGGDITVTLDYIITNDLPNCRQQVLHGYRLTDDCGNLLTKEIEWFVILDGSAPPILTVLAPNPVDVGTVGARAPGDPTCTAPIPALEILAEGGCGSGPIQVTQNPPPGTPVGPGVHPITVTATDGCDNGATQVVNFNVTGTCEGDLDPGISLSKTVAAGSNASCPGLEQVTGTAGMPVTWCFLITNTGDVSLDNIVLGDPAIGLSVNLGTLAPGASANHSAPGAVNGDFDNTADVVGTPSNGRPDVRASDPAGLRQVSPRLRIEKSVAAGQNANCPGSDMIEVPDGAEITWCFRLTNTGDVTLDNLLVDDPLLGSPLSVPGSLAPGESTDYAHNATFSMPDHGMLTNTAVATADPDGLPAMAEGTSSGEDLAMVVGPKAAVKVTVFDDINNNQLLDEASTLGVEGVILSLTRTGEPNVIATATTAADGTASFDNLLSGEYTVSVNGESIPGQFTITDGFATQNTALEPCECVEVLVPLTAVPTVIELASLTAAGTTVSWTTAHESELIGYQLLNADGQPINERLILGGAAAYSVDTGSRSGRYTLLAVNTDLSTEEVATLDVIDATPVDGAPIGTKEGQAGTNLLLPGATEAHQNGRILNGVILQTDAGPALYLHVAQDGELTVK